MPDEVKKSQLRTIQYFYVDGSFEFGFGLMCLLLAGYFYAEAHLQGWLGALVDASLILVMIGGGYFIQLSIRKLKERITYPRTGYVSYHNERRPKGGWRIAIGLVTGGLVAALATVLVTTPRAGVAIMPAFRAILLGLFLALIGWRSAIPRFYLLALLSAALGAVLAFSGLEDNTSLTVYYAGIAAVLLLTGACVLWSYLRQNPASQEGE